MNATWQDLRHAGLEHHQALLAEAAQRRRAGQPRRGHPAADQPCPTVVRPRQIEDIAPTEAGFTAQEWRRLAILRWRYRQGLLTD